MRFKRHERRSWRIAARRISRSIRSFMLPERKPSRSMRDEAEAELAQVVRPVAARTSGVGQPGDRVGRHLDAGQFALVQPDAALAQAQRIAVRLGRLDARGALGVTATPGASRLDRHGDAGLSQVGRSQCWASARTSALVEAGLLQRVAHAVLGGRLQPGPVVAADRRGWRRCR